MSTAPNEEFDDEGNVVKVENLHFITGVLGQGAFGTVRLARRKLCPKTPSHPLTTQPATPFSEGKEKESFQENRKKHRQRSLHKSKSAPHEGSDFFSLPDEATTITTPSKPAHFERENTRRSPSVISNLGLFIRSRVSFDHDDDDEQLVAVKIFRKSILKRQRTMERDKTSHRVKIRTALEQVEREIALMKKLSHPNLVAMYEVIDSPESDMLYMVLEYMPLGEILTYQDDGTFRRKDPRPTSSKGQIDGIVNGYFNEEQAALYFVDILHGLAYLHQHHVCHRDLKPENILLGANGIAKVGDFGVSHIFDKESSVGVHRLGSANEDSVSAASSSNGESASEKNAPQQERRGSGPHPHNVLTRMDTDAALAMTGMAHYGLLTKTEGTWCFWSPEMCEGSQAFSGYAADMWAAGVCLYIFVTGRLPWYSEIPTDLFEMIGDAKIDYSGLGLSNSLIDLLKRCLEKCPGKRAGVGDCLKHPFLQVARAKRIKRLSTEFENSSKRKIVLNEDDIRAVCTKKLYIFLKLICRLRLTFHFLLQI
jgi:[calcium/calmodulin-dependent protein kinase] kinase